MEYAEEYIFDFRQMYHLSAWRLRICWFSYNVDGLEFDSLDTVVDVFGAKVQNKSKHPYVCRNNCNG